MEKKMILSTKFYFVNPVDLLSVIIDALIRLEFETYIIASENFHKLFHILENRNQNVVLFSFRNKKDVSDWLDKVAHEYRKTIPLCFFGAFVFSNMSDSQIKECAQYDMEVFPFAAIQENPVKVLGRIVTTYRIQKRRKYIRAKAGGTSEAIFHNTEQGTSIRAEVLDVSSHAFACTISPQDEYFLKGSMYENVYLNLKGVRMRISARLMGCRQDFSRIYLFEIFSPKVDTTGFSSKEKVPSFIKKRLYSYIKSYLTDDMSRKLCRCSEEIENISSSLPFVAK